MRVSVNGELFEATIRNTLEFAKCRELLASCKRHVKINPRASARIKLENIATVNTCGIATISLICDWMEAGVEVNLHNCGSDIHSVFDAGLYDKYFSKRTVLALSDCRECLEGEKPLVA